MDDEADELLAVTRQLRAQLVRHAAHGAWAAPGATSARPVLSLRDVPEEFFDQPIGELGRGTLRDSPGPEIGDIARRSLAQIGTELGECTRCKLATARKSIVFGIGAEDAPLVFVGEAPGEQEDRRGEPFVGPAGELLDKMIEAMGWSRRSVYITNILMCRPPGNRNPQPDEVAACSPFLDAKLVSIAPRVIIALGRPSANTLLGNDAPISALRGRFHLRHGVKVMPTFHPAYLLREPDRKRDAWNDLKVVMTELDRLGIAPPRA
jgi:DNA polymerase